MLYFCPSYILLKKGRKEYSNNLATAHKNCQLKQNTLLEIFNNINRGEGRILGTDRRLNSNPYLFKICQLKQNTLLETFNIDRGEGRVGLSTNRIWNGSSSKFKSLSIYFNLN